MYSFLLRKALPFTLTFIFGAALSALLGLFGSSEKKADYVLSTRTYEFGSRCRMRRHNLVAESKPLDILAVPTADIMKLGAQNVYIYPVRVNVTFGADGKVQKVEPLGSWRVQGRDESAQMVWEAVESAAMQIQFVPETINSVPVSVTREVTIALTRCAETDCVKD